MLVIAPAQVNPLPHILNHACPLVDESVHARHRRRFPLFGSPRRKRHLIRPPTAGRGPLGVRRPGCREPAGRWPPNAPDRGAWIEQHLNQFCERINAAAFGSQPWRLLPSLAGVATLRSPPAIFVTRPILACGRPSEDYWAAGFARRLPGVFSHCCCPFALAPALLGLQLQAMLNRALGPAAAESQAPGPRCRWRSSCCRQVALRPSATIRDHGGSPGQPRLAAAPRAAPYLALSSASWPVEYRTTNRGFPVARGMLDVQRGAVREAIRLTAWLSSAPASPAHVRHQEPTGCVLCPGCAPARGRWGSFFLQIVHPMVDIQGYEA